MIFQSNDKLTIGVQNVVDMHAQMVSIAFSTRSMMATSVTLHLLQTVPDINDALLPSLMQYNLFLFPYRTVVAYDK